MQLKNSINFFCNSCQRQLCFYRMKFLRSTNFCFYKLKAYSFMILRRKPNLQYCSKIVYLIKHLSDNISNLIQQPQITLLFAFCIFANLEIRAY